MRRGSGYKPSLTDSEIRQYIKQAQEGDLDAKEKVILAYLPFAKYIAKKHTGKGVSEEDLYQEACYGILMALPRYDVTREASFSTFAAIYMEKYIRDAFLTQNSNFSGCYNRDFYYEVKRYKEAVEKFKEERGAEPSDRDISVSLNISVWRTKRLRRAAGMFMAPSVDIDCVSNCFPSEISSRPLEDDLLNQSGALDTSKTLTPREIEVLRRRFGFTDSKKPETWPKISAAMGLSLETLRITYNVAIEKLRNELEHDSL